MAKELMIMYSVILFDLDGTLTDSGEGITNSVSYALERMGIKGYDRKTLYKFIGPPLKDSFAKYFGMTEIECEKAVKEYRVYFKAKGMLENTPYDNVDTMLKGLKSKGKTLIVATSKPEEFAVTILKHFGLFDYFDYVCGASMDGKRSVKRDVIKYALKKAGIADKSLAVMVGDHEHDVIGAKENGLDSIGVTYGFGSFSELENAGADYIVKTVDELEALLNQ